LDVTLDHGDGRTSIYVDAKKIRDSDLRYLLPGENIILEMDGPIVRSLYRKGSQDPFYTNVK